MSTVIPPAEERVVLGNVSWSTYLALSKDAQNPRGRMAYDRGVLEIMSPSAQHEIVKTLIGRMVETFTLELAIEIRSVGATTFKRVDLEKGIEADECYYIESAAAIRDVEEIDLSIHPPPDLAVEVDISRRSQIKLGIYAAIRVPEVWRYDGAEIHLLVLRDGDYEEVEQSRALPQFPVALASQLLQQRRTVGETELISRFRIWVQEQLANSE